MASIFGASDEAYKKATGKTFNDLVEEWANKAVVALRESLQKKVTLTTSKNLEQSIVALPIEIEGSKLTIEIQAADYWKFVNEGVRGVGGTMKSGVQWVNKSPSSPFSYKEGKKPSPKHFVDWAYLAGKSPFAVSETVFRSGIKANHFFDEVINSAFEKMMADDLTNSIGRAIELDIKADFDGISN